MCWSWMTNRPIHARRRCLTDVTSKCKRYWDRDSVNGQNPVLCTVTKAACSKQAIGTFSAKGAKVHEGKTGEMRRLIRLCRSPVSVNGLLFLHPLPSALIFAFPRHSSRRHDRNVRHCLYGLNTSTAMTTTGLRPLFSAQWVMALPSVQLSPSLRSCVPPPSTCSVSVPCRT